MIVLFIVILLAPQEETGKEYLPKRDRKFEILFYKCLTILGSWISIPWDSTCEWISTWTSDRRQSASTYDTYRHRSCLANSYSIKHTKFKKHLYMFPLMTMAAVAYSANHEDFDGVPVPYKFDTDSVEFGIDNRCSACISDRTSDFLDDLQPTKRIIKGFAGSRTSNVQVGTMKITIEDDDGKPTTFLVPKSYYVPDSGSKLLSPQHWSSCMTPKQRPLSGTTPEQTFHDRIILTWNQNKSCRTVLLDKDTNVGSFAIAPAYNRFSLFCQEASIDIYAEDQQPLCIESSAVQGCTTYHLMRIGGRVEGRMVES